MVLPSQKKQKAELVQHDGDVPGLSASKAAASLVLADLVTRAGNSLLKHFVKSTIVKGSYDKKTAKALVGRRTPSQKVTALALAQVATRSVPGAAVVGAGLVAATIYRRGKAKRDARIAGDSGDSAPEA